MLEEKESTNLHSDYLLFLAGNIVCCQQSGIDVQGSNVIDDDTYPQAMVWRCQDVL